MAVRNHVPLDKLWEHQRDATRAVVGYLTSNHTAGKSSLVTMPTGTGKTAVIACSLAATAKPKRHQLVLTPWDGLVRQLIADLDRRVWERLATPRPASLPKVGRLPSSSRIDGLPQAQGQIYIATIAAISTIYRKCLAEGRDPAEVFSQFDVVIVDEGHYEPAPEWSGAIRALGLPSVILTATPYRNDEKFFLIHDEHRYRLPHHSAVDQGFLRKPVFKTVPAESPEVFARAVQDFVAETYQDSPRVIIRCHDADSIERIVLELRRLGHAAVGVHDTFRARTGDPDLLRSVPQTDSTPAQFWVHQNKLVEGVDDPQFKVLAFYDALRNDRAVVQQIGRILRNPSRDHDDATAYVLGRDGHSIERVWRAYETFDRQPEARAVATMPNLVDEILDAQPAAFYYDGGFRTRVDLNHEDSWRDFAYPLKTCIFQGATGGLTVDDIAGRLVKEWGEIDRTVFRTQRPDEGTVVIPYVAAENSPLLRFGTFIEPRFGYTIVRISGDLLFFFDTRGRVPRAVLEPFSPLPPTQLSRLFPADRSSLTSVSLANTDISRQAARSRRIRAFAIEELAPELADYAYVCSTAEGRVGTADASVRRYVGMNRARVSDYRSTRQSYDNYRDWLDGLATTIQEARVGAAAFARYASQVDVPNDPTPAHVLLDVFDGDFIQHRDGGRVQLRLESTAYDSPSGRFEIAANDASYSASLTWEAQRRRYILSSPELEGQRFMETEGEGQELVNAINQRQAMRVVPVGHDAIYTHGQFFKPIRPDTNSGRFRLLDVLVGVEELGSVGDEKGPAKAGTWEPGTIFGIIDALSPSRTHTAPREISDLFPKLDLLLCTDLGTEIADFIACQPGRVAFAHAKASKKPHLRSASALHEVVGQAIKNLSYLQPLSQAEPPIKRWGTDWKLKGSHVKRLRHGTHGTPAEMWRHIRAVIADPQAEREVWLVLGQTLSVSELKRQADADRPSAEMLQIYSLLQNAWAAVSQIGARLRIFCSP